MPSVTCLIDVDDDWDELDDDEKQDYIHETFMDCALYPAFEYGSTLPAPPRDTAREGDE